MRVLVTGGAGLIGFHAAKHYALQGHHVTVFDNLERSKLLGHEYSEVRAMYNIRALRTLPSEHRVEWFRGDVSNSADWEDLHEFNGGHRYDLILHYAAQCGVPTSIARPRRDFEVNVHGTFNVLEYARHNGAIVCYASTNKVYPLHTGWILERGRWRFEQPGLHLYGWPETMIDGASRTPYGWSKYAGDLLCQEYHHTYGVKTGVFRMSCIYGPNQMGFEEQGWATWFAIATLKNLPITIYGDGCQVRDMLYVEDCVRAYAAFVESPKQHGVYNLGGGPQHTQSVAGCLGQIPEFLGVDLPQPLTFKDWRPLDQKCYVSDITKIKTEIGWEPTTDFNTGYAKTCVWAAQHVNIF